jgi:hypothetical protein
MKSVLTRAIATALAVCVSSVAVAAQPAKGPRTKDGKPDLNGIWQTLNSANYDLEPHAARAAMAMVPGQFVPVPAPQVVALARAGPGGQVLPAGRTARHLHAVSVPDLPEQLADVHRV